jgi:hypothetical protein
LFLCWGRQREHLAGARRLSGGSGPVDARVLAGRRGLITRAAAVADFLARRATR